MLMQIDRLASVGAAQYDAAKDKLAQDISRCTYRCIPLATSSMRKLPISRNAGPHAKGHGAVRFVRCYMFNQTLCCQALGKDDCRVKEDLACYVQSKIQEIIQYSECTMVQAHHYHMAQGDC